MLANVGKFTRAFTVLCNGQRIDLVLWKMKFPFPRWPLAGENAGGRKEGRGKRGLSFSLQGRAGIPLTATERGIVNAQLCVSSD